VDYTGARTPGLFSSLVLHFPLMKGKWSNSFDVLSSFCLFLSCVCLWRAIPFKGPF